MWKILVVGLGGFAGAVARWGLAGAVQRLAGSAFPAGTFVVNLLGCFAIGVVMSFVVDHQMLSPTARVFLLTGFLGAFTTFSTFGYETVELLRDGAWLPAALNVGLNVVVGLLAVFAGLVAGRLS